MTFMEKVIENSMDVWQNCANEVFLQEMGTGVLSKEKLIDYLIQDSIYLRDYLKVFAYAITKAKTWKEMQIFYSMLGYVNDGENVTRLTYLKAFGLNDDDIDTIKKRPQTKAYCEFLIATAQTGEILDILMAMLPCMLGYHYVFQNLKENYPQVMNGYYAPLVRDYTNQGYDECCVFWQNYTNTACENVTEARKTQLMQIFRQASLHEWYFWQMAGEQKEEK